MGHGLTPEVWASRFADELCSMQPQVPRSLALEVAKMAHETLGVLRPLDAVEAFLAVQKRKYERAGELTSDYIRKLTDAKSS